MPSYQVTYEADEIMTIKNYVAYNVTAALDAAIDAEKEKWKGRLVYVQIKKVRD